jgi:hypothetical protein
VCGQPIVAVPNLGCLAQAREWQIHLRPCGKATTQYQTTDMAFLLVTTCARHGLLGGVCASCRCLCTWLQQDIDLRCTARKALFFWLQISVGHGLIPQSLTLSAHPLSVHNVR